MKKPAAPVGRAGFSEPITNGDIEAESVRTMPRVGQRNACRGEPGGLRRRQRLSNFQGLSAHEVALASGLMVSWLGELLSAKGVITQDEAAAVIHAAEESAAVNLTASSPGAILAIQGIGRRWEAAGARKP